MNNKIYVGVHKTTDVSDGYMGSGKVILRAIKKHGTNNFKKEILEHFDNGVDMFKREKEVVTDEFLMREDVYNLRRGGDGGFDHINKMGLSHVGYNSAVDKCRAITPMRDSRGVDIRKKAQAAFKVYVNKTDLNFLRKKEYKDGVRISKTDQMNTTKANTARCKKFTEICHQQGHKNSQFGTMWITDGFNDKKIKNKDIIPTGWHIGRKTMAIVETIHGVRPRNGLHNFGSDF